VKHVPCRVLEARMSPVMDGRVVSRGHCFTNGNPELQPSFLAMDDAASSACLVALLSTPYLIATRCRSQVDPFIPSELSPHILA
jgi:hypothetical protein